MTRPRYERPPLNECLRSGLSSGRQTPIRPSELRPSVLVFCNGALFSSLISTATKGRKRTPNLLRYDSLRMLAGKPSAKTMVHIAALQFV